jgi:GNAT superfamily N-acetyltransferase
MQDSDTHIELVDRIPTVHEYLSLRKAVGWHSLPAASVEHGLAHTLYAVCVIQAGQVLGCGRVTGDGGIYFYIQDLLVKPQFQEQGLATRIMQRLMNYVESKAQKGAFIGLMSAPGLEKFYGRYGFRLFPRESPAMLIWK